MAKNTVVEYSEYRLPAGVGSVTVNGRHVAPAKGSNVVKLSEEEAERLTRSHGMSLTKVQTGERTKPPTPNQALPGGGRRQQAGRDAKKPGEGDADNPHMPLDKYVDGLFTGMLEDLKIPGEKSMELWTAMRKAAGVPAPDAPWDATTAAAAVAWIEAQRKK